MQRHSKFYNGTRGTSYDLDEQSIINGFFREKRNTRISDESGMLADVYAEGFTNLGPFKGLSDVWTLELVGDFDLDTGFTISFDIEILTIGTYSINLTGAWSTADAVHVAIAEAINDQVGSVKIRAASKGPRVFIHFHDESLGQVTNFYELLVDNLVITGLSNVVSSIGKKFSRADIVYPMAYWSHNQEAIILTVVPSAAATTDPDENPAYENDTTLCQLWRRIYNPDGTEKETVLLYNNELNWRLFKKPIVKGIIENQCISRIYITEGYNWMMSFNTSDEHLFAIAPETAVINPQEAMTAPQVTSVVDGGLLPTGAVQYVYRIIGANGSISIVSAFSNMVYLPISAMDAPTDLMYGGPAEAISGKIVNLIVKEINIEYERIQVIAVYRQSELAITDVEIIFDGNIDQSYLEVTHSRKGQGQPLTIGELFQDNKVWDKAKVIEVHDNHMIAAHLTGRLQDLNNFDALVKQYDVNGDTYVGDFNPNPDVYKYCKDQALDPNENNPKLILGGQSENYENGNGIKAWFVVDEYLVEEGAEHRTQPKINGIIKKYQLGTVTGVRSTKSGDLIRSIRPGAAVDPRVNDLKYADSYEGHNNPNMGSELAGYQQYETYRFGVVFGKNGKDMTVKFMCDIRFPDYDDDYIELDNVWHHFLYAQSPNGTIEQTFNLARRRVYTQDGKNLIDQYARSVKLRVDIRLPKEVQDQFDLIKIVRAERTIKDRTVFSQGLMSQVVQYFNHWEGDRTKNDNKYGQGDVSLLHGIRPNANYNPQTYGGSNGLRTWFIHGADQVFGQEQVLDTGGVTVKIIGELGLARAGNFPDVAHPNMAGTNGGTNKNVASRVAVYSFHRQNQLVLNESEMGVKHAVHCEPGQLVPGNAYGSSISFRNRSRGQVVANNGYSITGHYQMNSAAGTLIALDNKFTWDDVHMEKWYWRKLLVELRKYLPSQYGGKSKFSLENTQWISTGVVIPIRDQQYDHIIGGGDIYTNMVQFNQFDDGAREARDHFVYRGDYSEKEDFTSYGLAVAFISNNIGNYAFTHGEHWGGEGYGWVRKAEHFYNPAYHAKSDAKRFIYAIEEQICEDVEYPGLIAVSRSKLNGKRIDNWLQYPVFDFYEVDLTLGAITNIVSVKGVLWVIQENGLGILSFNPYAVQQTQDGAEVRIINGTGEKIKKITYVSKRHGSRHTHSRINGHDGVYIVDDTNYELLLLSDRGYKKLALPKTYSLWFRKMLKNTGLPDKPLLRRGIHGYFDSEHNEVVIQIDQE